MAVANCSTWINGHGLSQWQPPHSLTFACGYRVKIVFRGVDNRCPGYVSRPNSFSLFDENNAVDFRRIAMTPSDKPVAIGKSVD